MGVDSWTPLEALPEAIARMISMIWNSSVILESRSPSIAPSGSPVSTQRMGRATMLLSSKLTPSMGKSGFVMYCLKSWVSGCLSNFENVRNSLFKVISKEELGDRV